MFFREHVFWEGTLSRKRFGQEQRYRALVVQETEDARPSTLLQVLAADHKGVMRWCDDSQWELPDDAVLSFVESMIDMIGRPVWDTRKPVRDSTTHPAPRTS